MSRGFSRGRGGGGPPREQGRPYSEAPRPQAPTLFSPEKPDQELFDTLAEQQCRELPHKVNSSQLRRYFGELKGLYNQFRSLAGHATDPESREATYQERIAPRFKMLRSKLAYGRRPGARGNLDPDFSRILEEGIKKVTCGKDFERFVLHFEAVVGFMYGNDKVSKS